MKKMKKTLSRVQIDRDLKNRISAIEKATGLSVTDLAEITLRALAEYFEENGKRIILPLVVRRRSEFLAKLPTAKHGPRFA